MKQTPRVSVEQGTIRVNVTSEYSDTAFSVILGGDVTMKHAAEQFKKLADYLRLGSTGTNCLRDSKLTVEVG